MMSQQKPQKKAYAGTISNAKVAVVVAQASAATPPEVCLESGLLIITKIQELNESEEGIDIAKRNYKPSLVHTRSNASLASQTAYVSREACCRKSGRVSKVEVQGSRIYVQ
ncbi:unnamed protein product [Dibothriocephalus latus]|uniref:Uncharacterized protein n=1 Tax=Dibothriocephalus latus TaxID=60516 RepID=A0A3P7KXN7_DIBLA|nr:unnamed protein product [Dibothriocephalus latus]